MFDRKKPIDPGKYAAPVEYVDVRTDENLAFGYVADQAYDGDTGEPIKAAPSPPPFEFVDSIHENPDYRINVRLRDAKDPELWDWTVSIRGITLSTDITRLDRVIGERATRGTKQEAIADALVWIKEKEAEERILAESVSDIYVKMPR